MLPNIFSSFLHTLPGDRIARLPNLCWVGVQQPGGENQRRDQQAQAGAGRRAQEGDHHHHHHHYHHNRYHYQVINLTSQLATNAHVVSAFEQSLANMTSRLHQVMQL